MDESHFESFCATEENANVLQQHKQKLQTFCAPDYLCINLQRTEHLIVICPKMQRAKEQNSLKI